MATDKRASYEESRRLIRAAANNHNLVLFVGAGTSLDAGMPSWGEAVSQIASRLQMSFDASDMLKIPQYYYNARGKKDYTSLMRSIFKYGEPLHPQSIHEKIIALNADVIVTTNYDHLLEAAAEEKGEVLHVVSTDAELPYKQGKELIKMHGDFEHDNFVLKEEDYLQYEHNFKLIKNYITSLAGTKTFLFIGYSFSDPDVKQIFSWLKNTLGDDLQRAYMVSVSPYNEIQTDYFKNFGINVIFADQIPTVGEKGKENFSKTELLEKTLAWIMQKDEESLLDQLYSQIGAYQYLNVPYSKDVYAVLQKLGFSEKKLYLAKQNDEEKGSSDSPRIFLEGISYTWKLNPADSSYQIENADDNELLFLKFCYTADQTAEEYHDKEIVHNQKWYGVMDILFKRGEWETENNRGFISRAEYNKLKILLNVLGKAGFAFLCIPLKNGDNNKKAYLIPIFSFKNQRHELEMALDTFDFQKLKTIEQHNEPRLLSPDADACLEQAHIYYFLRNYIKAYNLVKLAASQYYRQPNYAKYFIAKCNQYYIGRALINGIQFGQLTDTEEAKIKKEYSQIDLEKVFTSLPALPEGYSAYGDKNQFLKDLYSFNVVYGMLQDVIKESRETKEEAEANYIFSMGTPAYMKLRKNIESFYRYQENNHFLVNDFAKVKAVYYTAVSALFSSVFAKDKGTRKKGIIPNRLETYNIHETELSSFEILLAVRFLSSADMEKLLRGHENINVSEEGIQYLQNITQNFTQEPEDIRIFKDYFANVIILAGHVKLSASLAEVLFNVLEKRLQNEGQIRRNYNRLYKFLSNVVNAVKTFGEEKKKLCAAVTKFINKCVSLLIECTDETNTSFIIALCDRSFDILKELGEKYAEIERVKEVLKSSLKETRKIDFGVCLYSCCVEEIRQIIERYCTAWKAEDGLDNYISYVFCVRAGIFPMQIEMEDKFLAFIPLYYQKYREKIKKGEHRLRDNGFFSWVYSLVVLAINGKFQKKEQLKEACRGCSLDAAVWLFNPDDESALAKFDSSWLIDFGDKLLEKIAGNASCKKKIGERMREDYLKGKLDDREIRLYFEYFS